MKFAILFLYIFIFKNTVVTELEFDWNFYLKYNPDIVKAGIITKDRAYEHFQSYGKNEKRWYNSKEKPSYDQCDRAKEILDKDDEQATNVYKKHCNSLLKLHVYNTKNWRSIGHVASWKYGLLYDMYNQETRKPLIVISNQSNAKVLLDFKINKSKVCFIVKPGEFTFETMKMKKNRLSQRLATIQLKDFISSLQRQTNTAWEAYFILTSKQSKYKHDLIGAFRELGKGDTRLMSYLIPSEYTESQTFDNSNNNDNRNRQRRVTKKHLDSRQLYGGGFQQQYKYNHNINYLVDKAIEHIQNLEQCSWISITSIDNLYGSNVVNQVLQKSENHYSKKDSNKNESTSNELVDMYIVPLDSKYYVEQDYMKRKDVNWDQRCDGFTSMLNSFYVTYTAQPVVLPGKIFLEAVFLSRTKVIADHFKLSLLLNHSMYDDHPHIDTTIGTRQIHELETMSRNTSTLDTSQPLSISSTTTISSSYPCIHQCEDGLLLQFLVRNRHWTYHRIAFDGLKSTIFQGPHSPTWCIAAKNVWFDNVDINRVGCYPHQIVNNIYDMKDNPLLVEKSLMDWKYYDQSVRVCLRLSAYGVYKLGIDHVQPKTHKKLKHKLHSIGAPIISSLSTTSNSDTMIWNQIYLKIFSYMKEHMKDNKGEAIDALIENLVIYDIQPITISMQSKEVLLNNIKIFSSATKQHPPRTQATKEGIDINSEYRSALYVIHVDTIDLSIITPYFDQNAPNIIIIERSFSWYESIHKNVANHHSMERHLHILARIFHKHPHSPNNDPVTTQATDYTTKSASTIDDISRSAIALKSSSFHTIVFCSTSSRGPLILRKNGQWLERFHKLLSLSTVGMVSVSASTFQNYDLSSHATKLPVNMETIALKASLIDPILDLIQLTEKNPQQHHSNIEDKEKHNDVLLSSLNLIKTIIFRVLDMKQLKIGSLLHFARLNQPFYEYNAIISNVAVSSTHKDASILSNIEDEYILSNRIPQVLHTLTSKSIAWNITSWCEIKPSEVVFMRWGGEKLGYNVYTGYECGNSLAVTGSRSTGMIHTIQQLMRNEPEIDLEYPESPIGGLFYDLYRDSSKQIYNSINSFHQNDVGINNNIATKNELIDDTIVTSNDNLCMIIRTTASHDRMNNRSQRYKYYEMDLQGLIQSLYWQTNPNWIAYFMVTDQSNFDHRLEEIINEYKLLYKDTKNRLNHIIVPPAFLPVYNDKDAGYTATDYVLNKLLYYKQCQWITVTNGDNAYGADIVENTLKARIINSKSMNTRKSNSGLNDKQAPQSAVAIPDMLFQPFSSRNLAEKNYVERGLQWNGDLNKRCISLEAMTAHTLLAFAVQPQAGVGSIDLASIFLNREKLLKEKVYFSNFTSAGCIGCQDGLLAVHLVYKGKFNYQRLPLDGLKSLIFHGPSELLCIAEGNVWLDFPTVREVGCLSHETVARYREEDLMNYINNKIEPKFDWKYFDTTDRICLRITSH